MGDARASVLTGETRSTPPPSEKRAGRRRVTAVELLIIVQAMARLMCDVDMAEQAELWRLEGGGSPREPTLLTGSAWPPSSPSEAAAEANMVEGAETIAHAMPESAAALAVARAAAEPAAAAVLAAVPLGAPVKSVQSTAQGRNSTVEAARARVRGPTLTERRLRAAADAEMADAERREDQRMKRQQKKGGVGNGGAERAAGDAGDESKQSVTKYNR